VKRLRVGIAPYEEMKARTIAIARGELKLKPGDPKVWFTSIESLIQVLSAKNRALLATIRKAGPQSLTELAQLTGRANNPQVRGAAVFLHFDNLNGDLQSNANFDYILSRLLASTS
jgi:predicted transcriptional regulator